MNEERYDEIKEAAKERANQYSHPAQWNDVYNGFISGARWADTHPHWISVKDELPEENKWVLTYNGTSINLLMLAGNGGWYDHSAAKHRNVTHWMPLPAPPAKLSNVERIGKGGEQ